MSERSEKIVSHNETESEAKKQEASKKLNEAAIEAAREVEHIKIGEAWLAYADVEVGGDSKWSALVYGENESAEPIVVSHPDNSPAQNAFMLLEFNVLADRDEAKLEELLRSWANDKTTDEGTEIKGWKAGHDLLREVGYNIVEDFTEDDKEYDEYSSDAAERIYDEVYSKLNLENVAELREQAKGL